MTSKAILCLAMGLVLTACNSGGGSGSSSATTPGQNPSGPVQTNEDPQLQGFRGTWLSTDIQEYLTKRDPKIICDNIERDPKAPNDPDFHIDGYVIDGGGNARDFRINGDQGPVMAQIRADGSTVNVFPILHKHDPSCQGCADLLSLQVVAVSRDLISFRWTMQTPGQAPSTGDVRYQRMSDQQIRDIRGVFQSCR